ncbi:MAG: leucyl aminopeptidase [Proteobacteria bacterium]|nr:leucyl aminopeptidase [Pseudomonadota bacterium]NIS67444.1 leucyl aminopeptidase [Pseudomonadota bacterium]
MKILVEKKRVEAVRADALLLYHFEGEKAQLPKTERIDRLTGGLIREVIKSGDFKGGLYQTALLYNHKGNPAKRILMVGLGKKGEFTLDRWRGTAAKGAQVLRDLGVKIFATPLVEGLTQRMSLETIAQGLVEGVSLGLYEFNELKTRNREKRRKVDKMFILEEEPRNLHAVQRGALTGETIVQGVYLARDLVSRPGNLQTPTMMARTAEGIAKECGLKLTVLEERDAKREGMGAFLAVARGSDEPAKFIVLEYEGRGNSSGTVVLVGKGITFDSGGISIKPSDRMQLMKNDMGGGAAVLATLQVAAKLRLPIRLVGIVPCTENLPSGKAYKPGDVITSLSGQTIEIVTTDAEGRLILADGLTYARRFKPDAIIDLATLTGSCIIALGDRVTGMLGNNGRLKTRVKRAAEFTGEKVWELPLWEDYQEQIKSDIADMKNMGGRSAGTITGAALLSRFVDKTPWVHLDIAGPVFTEKSLPYIPKGATGVGVRLLVHLLRDWTQ